MKKLLIIILAGLVIAAGASYFGMQWRVKKAVDDMIASAPMVDARYSGVSLDFNGKLAINDLEVSVLLAGLDLSIGQISIETDGFWQTLQLDKDLEEGRLPNALKFALTNVAIEYTPEMAAGMSERSNGDTLSEMLILGCGETVVIGTQEFYDMGVRSINFDLKMGYDYTLTSDQLVASIDAYIDGIGHVTLEQTAVGLAPIMQNYRSAMFGFDPTSVTTQNIHLEYADLGYNAKVRDFCVSNSGLSTADYLTLHETMFQDALDRIDFTADFDYMSVYRELKDARSRLVIDLRPLPGFSMADMQLYDMSDLINLLELTIRVNDRPVDIGELSFDSEKWSRLNLSDLRRSYRVGPDADGEVIVPEEEAPALERILKEVPVATLDQYVFRTVQIQRVDGQVFSGEMTSVNANRVIIRSRMGTGFTDLPIPRSQIKVAKLYPEN